MSDGGSTPPLRPVHKWSYAVGHALNDLTASAWFGLVLLVFVQVDSLSKHDAGVLMLVGQARSPVADALATPVVGYLSDRTRTAWGSRRPWHLAGCVAVALSFPALLGPSLLAQHLSAAGPAWLRTAAALRTASLLYYGTVVVVFQVGWAASQVAHMAMCPELSSDFGERTELNSMRYAATVACNLIVYAAMWALLLGHTGPLRPEDQGVFAKLSALLLALGLVASVYFHWGMFDLSRRGQRRAQLPAHPAPEPTPSSATAADCGEADEEEAADVVGPLVTFTQVAPAAPVVTDSWDSYESGGGYTPLVTAPPPTADAGAPAEYGSGDSWDSFEGFLFAAHGVPPPLPQQTASPETAASESGGEQAAAVPHVTLAEWFSEPELYRVAVLYMCSRLILNVSQVYLPLYLVATLRLPTACIANVPLALYIASMAATPMLRSANLRLGRTAVMSISLLIPIVCSVAWARLSSGVSADFGAAVIAATLGWSSSCAMVTTLSMAADIIGARHSSGAIIYGLLSFTDKLSSGVSIMLVQSFDPSCSDADNGGAMHTSSCADAAANYYRAVMVLVPGGSAVAGLFVLAASAAAKRVRTLLIAVASVAAPASDDRIARNGLFTSATSFFAFQFTQDTDVEAPLLASTQNMPAEPTTPPQAGLRERLDQAGANDVSCYPAAAEARAADAFDI